MKKRTVFLFLILLALAIYFFIFSIRSPFRDETYPFIFSGIANKIQPDVEPDLNTHNIVFKRGMNIHAALLREDVNFIVARKYEKDGSYSDVSYAKRDLLSCDVRPQAFPVSASEIIAKRLFPNMVFYRREHITIFTDSGYGQAAPVVGVIGNLQEELENRFDFLFKGKDRRVRFCVVIFQKDGAYSDFVKKTAPGFEESVGFYSHDYRMLFVDNSSSMRQRFQYPNNSIRHEVAHQLFYHSGLHFGFNIDRPWLVEGLAVYCEAVRVGEEHRTRLNNFKKMLSDTRVIPLSKLLKIMIIPGEGMIDFYDQSWAFVYFLMTNYEDEFNSYLMYLKQHPFRSFWEGDAALLEEAVGKSLSQIESEFKVWVRNL